MAQIDTVAENFYRPLQKLDKVGDFLFWLISILSFLILFVDSITYPRFADTLQATLIMCVILFFIQGQLQKLGLYPKAEHKRRQQLLSDSFGVPLTHETTVGYYNNGQTIPIKRLASSVMESAFFTNAITKQMLPWERLKTGGYLFIYIAALLNRSTELELLSVAAQALFGGEIISRWLRLEWLNWKSSEAFDNLNRLLVAGPAFIEAKPQAETLDQFTFYESSKTTAAVLLSQKLFDKHNARLSAEWNTIRSRLSI